MFVSYGDYNDAYQALIQGLSEANPYLCGEQFTVADVSVGAMLLWQLKMNTIESHPTITRYVETIKQREGLKQSSMGGLL
ncbi:glutathione S-transferase [Acinetobacter baumannii]|nr:glutathione S-transferase [Acinetobacter baumannii]